MGRARHPDLVSRRHRLDARLDVSINVLSLFAFIVVLGIVVDDAIIVGENIYSAFSAAGPARGSGRGRSEVSTPVIFAVLTTIAAFAPLLNVPASWARSCGSSR